MTHSEGTDAGRSGLRRLAALVVVVGTVLASLAAPVLPAGGSTPPSSSLRHVRVELPAAAADRARTSSALAHGGSEDTDGWRVGAPLDAGDAVMVGADWGGDEDVEVELRSSRGGTWSDWVPLDLVHDHTPDAGTAEAERVDTTVTDPVWIGPSGEIQLRVRGGIDALDVQLVDMSGGDGLGYRAPQDRAAAQAEGATTLPRIRTRADWGADESLRDYTARYSREIRFAVVHHTAGTYPAGPEEVDDEIRAVYRYHTSNGWDDIAYNFVIDPYGGIWEGRYGGIEKAVIGGHAAGYNLASVGVVVLGNYQTR